MQLSATLRINWTTACKWDTVIPFDEMWERLNKLIKPNGAIVLFGSEPFSSALRMSNIKNYKYDWIWEKTRHSNFAVAKYQPLKKSENILVFSNKTHKYYPQMEKWEIYNTRHNTKRKEWWIFWNTNLHSDSNMKKETRNTRFPSNIIKVKSMRQQDSFHPTAKPVALMEYLIKTYTNEWETILDFTCGSWTTLIACQNTNRNWIGIEMDKWYYEIAKQRIQENKKILLQNLTLNK